MEKGFRPFGPAIYGTSPHYLLHFDNIGLGPSPDCTKIVLMLSNGHSEYNLVFAFPDTSPKNEAVSIIYWCAALGVPNVFMSAGSIPKQTVWLISKFLEVPHDFTLTYCPWSNGAF